MPESCFGGLPLALDRPFLGLPASSAGRDPVAPTVSIRGGEGGVAPGGVSAFRWRGSFHLSLLSASDGWWFMAPGVGAVRVADDCLSLWAHSEPDGEPVAMSNLLVGRVLPRVATRLGRLVLHAATVADGGGAVLLLGDSGAGKSTLSSALAGRGWTMFCDDASVLDADRALVWPGSIGASLWPDSRRALDLDGRRHAPLPRHAGEKHWVSLDGAPSAPARVRRLVFLDRRSDGVAPELRPLSKVQALQRLTSQLIRFNPADRSAAAGYVRRMGALVDRVPADVLRYPTGYDHMGAVASLLSADRTEAAA